MVKTLVNSPKKIFYALSWLTTGPLFSGFRGCFFSAFIHVLKWPPEIEGLISRQNCKLGVALHFVCYRP